MSVKWVTGDSVNGDDRRLWLETQPQAPVLAVSGKAYLWLDGRQRQVKTILAALPEEGWTELSAGDGMQGPRWYDWRWLSPAAPIDLQWRRWHQSIAKDCRYQHRQALAGVVAALSPNYYSKYSGKP